MNGSLNEVEVIGSIIGALGKQREGFSPIGDDVAWFRIGKRLFVLSCDMLVSKTDVPTGMKPWQVARKSVAMCVSDFAAKGVRPIAALISMGLPRPATREFVKGLASGLARASKEFGVTIIGGDTNESSDLVIDCILAGYASSIVSRSGARPRDVVVVSGPFGYTSAGLKILLERARSKPGLRRRALHSTLMPSPRLALGLTLASHGLLSASMDSSDGLALTLHEIAVQSGVGIRLSTLPTDDEVRLFADTNLLSLEELVLYGGEEYEIVATLPRKNLIKAAELSRKLGSELIRIGEVVAKPRKVLFAQGGKLIEVERRGWVHLA